MICPLCSSVYENINQKNVSKEWFLIEHFRIDINQLETGNCAMSLCGLIFDGDGSGVYENVSRGQIGWETCSDKTCVREVKRRNLARHREWFPDEYEDKSLRDRIHKSVGLHDEPLDIGEMMIMGPTGALIGVESLPQQVHVLQQKIEQINKILVDRIEQVEKIRFVEFKNNDAYEVNKRIERLERKIALLESNSNSSAVSANFVLILIAINNLFLGLAWWIYG